MSKSLGTGIDPLDEIDVHGADALRFGLLAMSSSQDVRYSPAKVQQGRDLANKIWNASRLVLLNAGDARPAAPAPCGSRTVGSSRALERTVASVSESIDSYDFAHAALDFYAFFWSELCDWYLEIVKPRLYGGDEDAAANLLGRPRAGARGRPSADAVRDRGGMGLSARPRAASARLVVPGRRRTTSSTRPRSARSAPRSTSSATVRRWRDLVGVPAGSVLTARVEGDQPHELVARLARLRFEDSDGEALAAIRGIELLASEEIDAGEARRRIEAERERLRGEIERLERKLAKQGFVDKAPPEVVEDERRKLDGYRAELEELG